jgi:WD40 repeat protein
MDAKVEFASDANDTAPKARIFISYSRKDLAFADRLEAALKTRGFEPLIDRTEIYAFEDWWKRIEALIGKADTVVFVLSPDAITSDVALKEVAHAASLNKRFAPIVCRRVEEGMVPEALRRLNFIFFDDPGRFEASADQLAEALQTDIGWIRQHTEFGEAAHRWSAAGRPRGLLLRSPVLEEAERWIASRPQGAPSPTKETQLIISESRRSATRRRNVLTGGLAAAFLVTAVLAGVAFWQRQAAEAQRAIAVEQRDRALRTQALLLADQANSRSDVGDSAAGILLALEALPDPTSGVQRPYVVEAEAALFKGVYGLREAKVFAGHSRDVRAAFSPNGRRIATGSLDRRAAVWDIETGRVVAVFGEHRDEINDVTFSSDGRRVLTASSDHTARVWDAETGNPILTLDHPATVNNAEFSRDGSRIVTSAADKTARIWDANTGKVIKGLPHDQGVRKALFSPDGRRVVTSADDGRLRIWDVGSGAVIAVTEAHLALVWDIALSPDGQKIASGSADGTRIWDAETGKLIKLLASYTTAVLHVAFSPNSQVVITASFDRIVRLWYIETAREFTEFGHAAPLMSATIGPNGQQLLTGSSDGTARLWDYFGKTKVAILKAHTARITSAVFSRDGHRVLTASHDRRAKLWDVVTEELVATFAGHSDRLSDGDLSPDGRLAATASYDGTARIWDIESGQTLHVLLGHQGAVASVRFSADGRNVVTAAQDKTARLWDVATGGMVLEITGHIGAINMAVFAPNGLTVATASQDGTARIWDAKTGESLRVFEGHTGPVLGINFSPDGRQVVSASTDKTARIWEVASGKTIRVLTGSSVAMIAATFSPDARHVATTGAESFARLWDAETGKIVGELIGADIKKNEVLPDVRFSPDGRQLVTPSTDGYLRIWPIYPNAIDLAAFAKRIIPRCLSPDDRDKISLDPDPPAWCIEMAKWPYDTEQWKAWLRYKQANLKPPRPDSSEWDSWAASHPL